MLYFKKGATEQQVIEHFENHEINGVGKEMASGTTVWYEQNKYKKQYLTFVSQSDSNTFKFSGSTASNTLQYSLDNGSTWSTLANDVDSPAVASGNTIMFKGSGLTLVDNKGIGHFSSSNNFKVQGNAMSLLYGDNFVGKTSLSIFGSVLMYLFSACTGLTTAENMILPATKLVYSCYGYMFAGCTSLTTAPELPATSVATSCYLNMFNGCTSLTTAPELPATKMEQQCYMYMFSGCTNLNYIKCLASSGMTSSNCFADWLSGVASTGTFVKSPNATTGSTEGGSQWKINYSSGIPTGWTVQDAS